jgi:hypothetical protein
MSDNKINDNPQEEDEDRISWHPAFFEAIKMELKEYGSGLQFISEFQLTTEPLRIDVVIIKKVKNMAIKKNIGFIFRKENIVEYKSPDDHVSVSDFYYAYAYAGIYQYIKKIDMEDMTLTFVGSHHSRELLKHLEKKRGYLVEEKWPGIYIVSGDVMPVQIIDSRKLSMEDNKWLRSLDNKLGKQEKLQIMREILREGDSTELRAYYYVMMRVYEKIAKEEIGKMNPKERLEKMLVEAGATAKFEAIGEARGRVEGEERKAAEIAKNMLKSGFSMEQVAELAGLDVGKIRALSV